MDKKSLTEADICTKFINPAIIKAGWDIQLQVSEQKYFTDGRIYVKGKLTSRGIGKKADYILYYKPNIPLAIIEAKVNTHSIRSGIQQAIDYAKILDVPFVFSSNGEGFLFHDKTAIGESIETEISLEDFPSPQELWNKYKKFKNIISPEEAKIVSQDYFVNQNTHQPRYYQLIAINKTIEAIAKGKQRILLVMATGTGKTDTTLQIAYRLWKAGTKKRILFLADRNILIKQARDKFNIPFKNVITKVQNRVIDKSYEFYLALYQGISGTDEDANAYKQFSKDFFDLIIIDECHRGSANEDSNWREILNYFNNATHIGLTATPKETNEASNSEYFGDPIYTYSLRQGIEDGFLAPYRVIRVGLNIDSEGWRPELGKTDIDGNEVDDRIYNRKDFDRNIVIEERINTVASKITEFLKGYDRFAKTIVFCVDIDHAERMRTALIKLNSDFVAENSKYIMQITGDNEEGKRELDNFIKPDEKYPVIVTTSELMTTGVDAQTCKVIVLDANINSTTKFKQIIGRGTRINEEFGKMFFTILDFRNVTDQFARPDFDGDPIRIKPVTEDTDLSEIINDEEQSEEKIFDNETKDEVKFEEPSFTFQEGAFSSEENFEKRKKVVVNGVDVSILISREMHFDSNGKPITKSLKDHTKEIIEGQFATLDDFLNKWNNADRKEAIIKELQEQGMLIDELYNAVDKQLDLFDLICHLAYDKPPLTRKERANNVTKRNYFAKYEEKARKVLESLLEKYANEGIENIENLEVLKVKPLSDYGSAIEIVKLFGTRENYFEAIKELENELYRAA